MAENTNGENRVTRFDSEDKEIASGRRVVLNVAGLKDQGEDISTTAADNEARKA
jgi:hypothetical protein